MAPGALFKTGAKAFAQSLVDEYRVNWIFASPQRGAPIRASGESVRPIDSGIHAALRTSPTPKVRGSLKFSEAGLEGLALLAEGEVVSVAHFAAQASYDRNGTWPLAADEIALIDVATEERARGRGHAVLLIAEAVRFYRRRGATRLIAFIWWTNGPSLRAFAKAGWRRIGLSVEWRIGGRWRGLRIPLRLRW